MNVRLNIGLQAAEHSGEGSMLIFRGQMESSFLFTLFKRKVWTSRADWAIWRLKAARQDTQKWLFDRS